MCIRDSPLLSHTRVCCCCEGGGARESSAEGCCACVWRDCVCSSGGVLGVARARASFPSPPPSPLAACDAHPVSPQEGFRRPAGRVVSPIRLPHGVPSVCPSPPQAIVDSSTARHQLLRGAFAEREHQYTTILRLSQSIVRAVSGVPAGGNIGRALSPPLRELSLIHI